MHLYKYILWLMLMLCVTNCAAQKKSDPKLPTWATTSLSDPTYYIGVGYAPKVKKSQAHYDQAHKAALNALASEISVEIKATTTLVSVSSDHAVQDDLSSIIQARATADIEGYEKVDSYENKSGYWVYYRLSRQKYAQREAQKREMAAATATTYYLAGEKAKDSMDLKMAIIQYAKALDAVKAYLNEKIDITVEGQSINLVQDAHSKIYQILNGIEITTETNSISCKMGGSIGSDKMNCSAYFQNKPVTNFPIVAAYSENAQKLSATTDAQGTASFSVNMVKSKKTQESISYEIDKNSLLVQSAADYAIRRWLLLTPTATQTVYVDIQKPAIFIKTKECVLANVRTENLLAESFRNLFLKEGYTIAATSEKSDYQLNINTDTQRQGQANGIYTAILSGRIELRANTGKMVYSTTLNNIKGTQLNYTAAGMDAYKKAVEQIENRTFAEMETTIRK